VSDDEHECRPDIEPYKVGLFWICPVCHLQWVTTRVEDMEKGDVLVSSGLVPAGQIGWQTFRSSR
jgi:hypothetical protein